MHQLHSVSVKNASCEEHTHEVEGKDRQAVESTNDKKPAQEAKVTHCSRTRPITAPAHQKNGAKRHVMTRGGCANMFGRLLTLQLVSSKMLDLLSSERACVGWIMRCAHASIPRRQLEELHRQALLHEVGRHWPKTDFMILSRFLCAFSSGQRFASIAVLITV
eukprot:4542065-Amphidinium_carterae.2